MTDPHLPSAPASSRRWCLAAVALAGVLVVLNRGLLLGTEVPLWDAANQFRPFFALIADAARAGELISWDPWTHAGAPLFAEPQVGALSLPHVLAGWLLGSSLLGFVCWWLFVWWLGGVGILCLARALGAPVWGGFATALGFVLSGLYTGHAEHPSWLWSLSLWPFVVWRLDVALRTRRTWPAVEAGALWGLSACGGYPGLTIASGIYLAIFALGRPLGDNARSAFATYTRSLGALVAVGLVVMAATYVSFFRAGAGYHDRVGALPREIAVAENALEPGALATLATPTLAALKAKDRAGLWPTTDASSVSVYLGVGVLLLAVAGFALRPRSRRRIVLLLLAILGVCMALGGHLPLRGWLYDLLPPTRYFRQSTLFRSFFVLAVAHLALLGSRDVAALLASDGRAPRRPLLWAALGLVVLAVATIAYHCVATTWNFRPLLWATGAFAVLFWGAAAVLVVLLAGSEPARRRRWIPAGFVALALLDAGATRTLNARTICHDDSGALAQARDLDAARSASFDLAPGGVLVPRAPWAPGERFLCNAQLVTKQPVLGGYTTQENRFHTVLQRHPELAAMALGTHRFWFHDAPPQVPWSDTQFAALLVRTTLLGVAPLVLHDTAEVTHHAEAASSATVDITELPACEPAAVTVKQYRPDVLEFACRAPRAGWLLVTDRWAPDWRAEVDGRPVAVRCANFVFRAVPVHAGDNVVRFTYATGLYDALTALGWLALLLVLGRSVWNAHGADRGIVVPPPT
ncbi:MAG: hypothetical protein H6838_07545 [Planctomycetes bacterium]|nr:hypothetical protein [Planctomycetota bacterium]MCB9885329.1 hypothetical protein [Planctomycetota bacterium]